jgi:hypothetical protein
MPSCSARRSRRAAHDPDDRRAETGRL